MSIQRIVLGVACALLFAPPVMAFRGGPPAGANGSVASFGNSCRACHGNAVGGGSVQILGLPAAYSPNVVYDISVRVADATKLGAGFQISVEDAGGVHRGTLILTNATNTQLNSGWVNHTGTGVNNAVANWAANGNSATYSLQWQAPASNLGPLTFWAAGNAINNNFSSSGDTIYLTNATRSFSSGTGACCDDSTGVCTEGQTQAACEGGGGRFGGADSTCGTINPPCVTPTGACCDDVTGVCADDQTQAACESGGGRYGGNDSTCGDIDPPCLPPVIGACCDDRGICLEDILQADCLADGSRFGGEDSTCGDIDPPCVVPVAISLEPFVTGLSSPVDLTHAGDGSGRIFIVDQVGQIRVVLGDGTLLPTPFLDISSLIPPPNAFFDERGLLGLAFHPDYETNGRFFIRYSKPRAGLPEEPCNDPTGFIVGCHEEILAEYQVMGDPATSNVADPNSEIILFRADKPQFNHNSGQVAFGPDGYLYFTLGDGGGAHDGLADGDPPGSAPSHGPFGNGQNRFAKLGKMHRIDVNAAPLVTSEWIRNPANNHWYRLTSPGLSWQQAEDEAQSLGGHLVTINDSAENQWVLDNLGHCDFANGARWIGFHQLPSSTEPADGWVWSNGEPVTFVNWDSNEPNNNLGKEQWAEMRGQCQQTEGRWNDQWPPHVLPGVIERGPAYDIPANNPFADGINGLPEIYAYGLRNAFKFSFDDGPGGTGALWLPDVGQNLYEEINIGALGANYGWVIREAAHCFDPFNPVVPPASCDTTGALGEPLIDPVMEYLHSVPCTTDADCAALGVGCDEIAGQCENEGGISIIGGFVYRGTAIPELAGKYAFGDFSDAFFAPGGRLYYMDTTGPDAYIRRSFYLSPDNGAPLGQFLKGYGEDQDGELYVLVSTQLGPLGNAGSVLRIAPGFPTAPTADPSGIDKSKFISFVAPEPTLAGGSVETALRINLMTLHNVVPPYGAVVTVPFTAFEGQHVWVGPPSTFTESAASGVQFRVAQTRCTPHYRDWSAEGLLHVTGSAIVPSSVYHVESVAAACSGVESSAPCVSGGSFVSSGHEIRTTRWCDVETPFNPPSATAQPDLADVGALVNKFRGQPGAPIKARAILALTDAFGNIANAIIGIDVSLANIAVAIDSFRGLGYPGRMGKCAASSAACTTNPDCGANGPCNLYCPP